MNGTIKKTDGLKKQTTRFDTKENLFYHSYRDHSLVHRITKINKDSKSGVGPLTVDDFLVTLSPFKWVDWTNRELENAYPGSGEKGRRSLEVWLCDALLNKEQYKPNEIINENMKSKPGR